MTPKFQISAIIALLFAVAAAGAEGPVDEALRLLDNAESKFNPPSSAWFDATQAAVQAEVDKVGGVLEDQGPDYAAAWKNHLRWQLLEANLGPPETIDLAELRVVRRWLYSNRKGLEYPLFAQLRTSADDYLDAVFTLTRGNLQGEYYAQVALARRQIRVLADNPSPLDAAALGRTLGWLETTRQLNDETAAVRRLLSLSNAQLVISRNLVDRVMASQETEVSQSVRLAEIVSAPGSGLVKIPRSLQVTGRAESHGMISLALLPNGQQAEAQLTYHGQVMSLCRAAAGPVALNLVTAGPVTATKSMRLSPTGLDEGDTVVSPRVISRVASVTAPNELLRRIGRRRASRPESRSHMAATGRRKTVSLLQQEMDDRVESALAQIRAQFESTQASLAGFSDVLAPVVREGATPRWTGASSTADAAEFHVTAVRRDQFGAASACPIDSIDADVIARLHVSFFNNMLETILGGKRLSDEFLMRYAEILQPELPLPLMVHSRATRWAIHPTKTSPLQLRIPAENQLVLRLQLEAVEIDGEKLVAPTVATITYRLSENEFGEYELVRLGDVELATDLPTKQREFLHQRLDAFFAPLLNGGGVVIPSGGVLGSINLIESAGVVARDDWIVTGLNLPMELLQEIIPRLSAE